MERFSTTLETFISQIENPALQGSLLSLEAYICKKIEILAWGYGQIAVPLEIGVDLPSLGNVDGIDIRQIEPIIMVFDLVNYPLKSPKVYTDRLDFPKNNLAHLYVAVKDRPPGFCYVRENSDEWYANKRIEDLLIRISNWLRDAALGELTEDGDQFDPLRLEGYSGTIIYDYDAILRVVDGEIMVSDKRLALAVFERPKHTESFTFKFVRLLTAGNAIETIKYVDKELKKDKEDITRKNYYYGYIVWGNAENTNKDYYVNLPRNWEEFKKFCDFYNVGYSELENFIATCDQNIFINFPVIVGIRRPRQIIGYSSNIEFINFRFWVNTDDVKDGKIANNITIDFLSHNQPLTPKQASRISDCTIDYKKRSVVFGCGALGSKVVMHLARSGYSTLTLIDPDHISPHNLVRHALYGEDEGANKAIGLAERINAMYHTKNAVGMHSLKNGVIDNEDFFEIHDWIFDFTASDAFFHKLTTLKSIDEANVASASISDFGNLGIMYKEGESRNPRLDDLQAYLYSLSLENIKISDWLQREKNANTNHNVTVRVGIGCNSETTILADDKVSTHSSYFSSILKREITAPLKDGKIYLSRIEDGQEYEINTKSISVMPFDIFRAINNSEWSIRFKGGVIPKIEKEYLESGKSETGGVFVGLVNYKTSTIHVIDSVSAPIDSKADFINFTRGSKGLPEEIAKYNYHSGGQVGYIGEWHSHPDGPNELSEQDMESVYKHKSEFIKLNPPLPVFLTIITPDGLFPFLF